MPEVSVIIPNYNHAAYLKQRIDSVLNQSFGDIEVIILDDCSTDNSREVIEQYRTHRLVSHIVYNEQNSGSTFLQWKKGIALAAAGWIWIAESDDWCESTLLETLVPAFSGIPACSIAFCQSLVLENSGKIVANSVNPAMEELVPGKQFIAERMLYGNAVFNASMAIFRKENYSRVTDRFSCYRFCGDWLFWIEMASQGNVYISGKILNYFRKHDRDLSSGAFASGLFYAEYIQLTEDLYASHFIDAVEKKKMIKSNFKQYYFQQITDASTKKKLSSAYRRELGTAYYFKSAGWLVQKAKNRFFSILSAIKRKLHLVPSQ